MGGAARKKKIQDDELAYQKLIGQYAGFFYISINFLSALTPSMFYMDRRVACSALRKSVCVL